MNLPKLLQPCVIKAAVIVVCVLPLAVQAQNQPPRDWTDAQGRSIKAVLVRVDGTAVVLRRTTDNREFNISLQQLSSQDQAWLKNLPARWDASLDSFRTELGTSIWQIYQRQTLGKTTPAEQDAWKKLVARYEKKTVRWPVEYIECEKTNQFEVRVSKSFTYMPGSPGDGTVRFKESSEQPTKPANGAPVFDHPIVIRAVPSTTGKVRWEAKKPGPARLAGTIDKIELLVPLFGKDPELATILVTLSNASPAD